MVVVGEVIYIGMFLVYGIISSIITIITFELVILWMPNWPGFSSGLYGVSTGVGALVLPQVVHDWTERVVQQL